MKCILHVGDDGSFQRNRNIDASYLLRFSEAILPLPSLGADGIQYFYLLQGEQKLLGQQRIDLHFS